MNEMDITRINELARKAKSVGLTPEEKLEQSKLRKEYIASIRMNLRSQLDNIDIQEPDGSVINLGKNMETKQSIRKRVLNTEDRQHPHS